MNFFILLFVSFVNPFKVRTPDLKLALKVEELKNKKLKDRESFSKGNETKSTKFDGKPKELHSCKVNSLSDIYTSVILTSLSPIFGQFYCSS